MAYEGFGSVGYLLGTLLSDAFNIDTRRRRERKRQEALSAYAPSLFEQPVTEEEAALFEHAPEEAFRIGVQRRDEKNRRERDEREAADRFQRQKDIITFREEEKKRLGTGAAPKGPTPTQEARFDKTGAYLSKFAATTPAMAAFLDEAKKLERGESDPNRYRLMLEAAFEPLLNERRDIEGRKVTGDYRTDQDRARAAELEGIDRAMSDAYLFGRVPRGTAAAAPTTGAAAPTADFPRGDSAVAPAPPAGGPFTPEPVDPAAPPQTDIDIEFEELFANGADPKSVENTLRSSSLAELQAIGIDATQRDYFLKKIDQRRMEAQSPDVQAKAPSVLASKPGLAQDVGEMGSTLNSYAGNVGRSASAFLDTILPGLGRGSMLASGPDQMFTPQDAGLAGQGFAADGGLFAPPYPDTNPVGGQGDILAALAELLSGGGAMPAQATQAEPGRNVFGKGEPGGRSSSNPDAMAGQQGPLPSLFAGPDALAGDELAAIQDFLAKEEQRRRIEKVLRMLEMVPN